MASRPRRNSSRDPCARPSGVPRVSAAAQSPASDRDEGHNLGECQRECAQTAVGWPADEPAAAALRRGPSRRLRDGRRAHPARRREEHKREHHREVFDDEPADRDRPRSVSTSRRSWKHGAQRRCSPPIARVQRRCRPQRPPNQLRKPDARGAHEAICRRAGTAMVAARPGGRKVRSAADTEHE